jgi:hypothetical protein
MTETGLANKQSRILYLSIHGRDLRLAGPTPAAESMNASDGGRASSRYTAMDVLPTVSSEWASASLQQEAEARRTHFGLEPQRQNLEAGGLDSGATTTHGVSKVGCKRETRGSARNLG